ncbi:MAG: tetratricopeptide repeat protein, partial [Limisphaerales bacterium]
FDPIRAAELEALRRAETRMVMDLNLRRAEEHRKSKRFVSAALLYEEAIRLGRKLGNTKAIAKDVTKAREGIVYSNLRLARSLQDQDFFKEADEVAAKAQVYDPDNRRLRKFRESNEKVRKAHIGRVPSREVQAAIQSHRNKKATVMTLVRDGKAYYELGQFSEADKRLKEAVKLDPQSDVAYYYLRLILEAKYDREGRARDYNFQKRVIEIAETWNR